ncbi:MAG: hypothetical protein A3G41_08565 [Elusimicrobia bacterium RIFCSPLOWO2_12_FULL_59_9]|nr:MAG: hypothetical protein A3G41_08565 [Elusimicrobia bacterium RIFCSPLOWO2_12_FULL_59_9]
MKIPKAWGRLVSVRMDAEKREYFYFESKTGAIHILARWFHADGVLVKECEWMLALEKLERCRGRELVLDENEKLM